MKTSTLVKLLVGFVFVLYIGSTVSLAADSNYNVSGQVVDINGNGIPGAAITLMGNNLQIAQTTTDASGYYNFNLSRLSYGPYQVFASYNGQKNSAAFTCTASAMNYSVTTIKFQNVIISVTPTAVPTATPSPTPAATATVAANVTATPMPPTATPTATPTVTPTPTPKPTPGIMFTFIPATLVVCLVALRKRS